MNFNGIEEIAGGFTSEVDYGKSSKIMFKLSMPQKAPKRRSPNTIIYVEITKKCTCNFNLDKIWLDAIVKNNGSFKAAIFKICCIS